MTFKTLFSSVLFLLSLCFNIYTLNGQASSRSEKDPKAKATLDLMKKRYESYTSLDIPFTLDLEIPEQPKQVQKGQFTRKGMKYKLVMNQQTVRGPLPGKGGAPGVHVTPIIFRF